MQFYRLEASSDEIAQLFKDMALTYTNEPETYKRLVYNAARSEFDWHNNHAINNGRSTVQLYMEDAFKVQEGIEGRNTNPLKRLVGEFGKVAEKVSQPFTGKQVNNFDELSKLLEKLTGLIEENTNAIIQNTNSSGELSNSIKQKSGNIEKLIKSIKALVKSNYNGAGAIKANTQITELLLTTVAQLSGLLTNNSENFTGNNDLLNKHTQNIEKLQSNIEKLTQSLQNQSAQKLSHSNKWTGAIIGTGVGITALGTAAYVYMKEKAANGHKTFNKIA